mmetsp:Transcript_80672/g.261462  ORF Transcript_80672/g.261462 Transcript_80672/m.261462 type:complete len:211 (-) Transcript_80672:16-648(-)
MAAAEDSTAFHRSMASKTRIFCAIVRGCQLSSSAGSLEGGGGCCCAGIRSSGMGAGVTCTWSSGQGGMPRGAGLWPRRGLALGDSPLGDARGCSSGLASAASWSSPASPWGRGAPQPSPPSSSGAREPDSEDSVGSGACWASSSDSGATDPCCASCSGGGGAHCSSSADGASDPRGVSRLPPPPACRGFAGTGGEGIAPVLPEGPCSGPA